MRDLAVLFCICLRRSPDSTSPGGARSLVAESVLVKQQLLILERIRHHIAAATPPRPVAIARTNSQRTARVGRTQAAWYKPQITVLKSTKSRF
jgi:hypothetical protein